MKNEPLKGKIKTMIGARPLPEFNFFFADDVKSAVQGLISDIVDMKKNLQKDLTRIASYQCETPEKAIEQRVLLEQVHVTITHLDMVLEKIKKWFADVVEE